MTKSIIVHIIDTGNIQPCYEGQFPTSVLTLVTVRSNSQFDLLFDNKINTNYSKELRLGFGEKLVNF